MSAHELLNGFHEFSMYSPTCLSLPPICFAQSWPLGTYYKRAYITWFYACNEEFCMGGCLQGFRTFFVMGWSKRLIAKKKTLELGRCPKLTTIDHNISQYMYVFLFHYLMSNSNFVYATINIIYCTFIHPVYLDTSVMSCDLLCDKKSFSFVM
jgi:hypothetical protein